MILLFVKFKTNQVLCEAYI